MTRIPKLGTRRAIAAMLTENTGRHLLDSGDAYGRNWQRNAGLTWRHFDAAPTATVDRWGCVTISVYHWMLENLTYDAQETARFRRWANRGSRADESWLSNMYEWAERVHSQVGNEYAGKPQSVNTYNGEDFLSQVLQWVEYEDPEWGGRKVLVQVHGGADVRGGYTAPRVFDVDDADYLYSYADATVHCAGTEDPTSPPIGQLSTDGRTVTHRRFTQHAWQFRSGSCEEVLTDMRDEFGTWDHDWDTGDPREYDRTEFDTDDDGRPLCPRCSAPLSASYDSH